MNAAGILNIFLGSFAAMMKVFLTCMVGVMAAVYPKGDPLLPDVALRHFSRLVTLALIAPLTTYALGSSLTPQLLAEYAILIPFCLLNIAFSLLIFLLLRPLHQKDEALTTASMVATMSPNIISMPLMMLRALCELNKVNEDYGNDAEECFTDSTGMLFVYSIAFNILFWSVLYPMMIDVADKINGAVEPDEESSSSWIAVLNKTKNILSRVFTTPAMIGIYAGLFVSMVPGLRGVMFGERLTALTPIGGTIRVLAEPVVCLNTLIMAASLAKVRFPKSVIDKYFWWVLYIRNVRLYYSAPKEDGNERRSACDVSGKNNRMQPRMGLQKVKEKSRRFQHSVLHRMGLRRKRALTWTDMDPSAVLSGIEFASVDAHGCVVGAAQEYETKEIDHDIINLTENPLHALHASGIPDSNGNIVSTSGEDEESEADVEDIVMLVSPMTFLVHILARLMLPPVFTIIALRLSLMVGILTSQQRMLQLVIVLESANPSAQIVIVVLNQLGVPDLAAQMSLLYVGQYLLSILTLTFWTSVGMTMLYET